MQLFLLELLQGDQCFQNSESCAAESWTRGWSRFSAGNPHPKQAQDEFWGHIPVHRRLHSITPRHLAKNPKTWRDEGGDSAVL